MRDLLYNVYYMSGTALKLFNVDCVDFFCSIFLFILTFTY